MSLESPEEMQRLTEADGWVRWLWVRHQDGQLELIRPGDFNRATMTAWPTFTTFDKLKWFNNAPSKPRTRRYEGDDLIERWLRDHPE